MGFPYKLPPMAHQKEAMKAAWPHTQFALFMEMGTGKTYTAINLAAGRFLKGQIEAMIIICPTPIKLVWVDEFEMFSPVPYEMFIMHSGMNKKAEQFIDKDSGKKLKVFVVGVEALSQGKAGEIVLAFARKYKVMTTIDESSRIKKDSAGRTKKAYKIGEESEYRLIMTGTPITQGIEDLYSQFKFLNHWIIGSKSFFTFRNRYCIMGGFENRSIIGYQNTNQMLEQVAKYVYTIKLADAVDMPDKIFRKLIVEPTKEQKDAIKSLEEFFEAENEGDSITTETVLERLTRYQQICGGNFPYADEDGGYHTKPISGGNPKLSALLQDIEDNLGGKKAVIWARFRPEINEIVVALKEKYGDTAVIEFHGGVDFDSRREGVKRFQNDPDARFFISLQQVGGMGITLTASHHTYYFSNSFSYEDRIQSEFRTWRKGQKSHCTYTDIILNNRYDKMTAIAISKKMSLAEYVDELIEHNQLILQKDA